MSAVVKRGWKVITNPAIVKIYNEVCDEARSLGLLNGTNPPLYSHKSYKSLGTCYSKKEYGKFSNTIVLSEYILDDPEKIRGIIIHEVGHATVPMDHHGYNWKCNTNKIGRRWGYTAERLCHDKELNSLMREHRPQNDYKYEVLCTGCGAKWKYKRAGKVVSNIGKYHCGHCGHSLVIKNLMEE